METTDIGGPSVSCKGHLNQEKTLNDKYLFRHKDGQDGRGKIFLEDPFMH